MRIEMEFTLNLKTKEVTEAVEKATRLGLRDTVVAIHGEAVRGSPILTGHNRRSIASEVSGMGTVEQGVDAEPEKVVDDRKLEAACYSTSGYGGFLETGTVKMAAMPYFRPALDRHKGELGPNIKARLEAK